MEDRRPRDAEERPLNDKEIIDLVRKGLAAGTLPRQILGGIASDVVLDAPIRHLVDGVGTSPEPCTVCGGRPTQVRCSPTLAFHTRCHEIWLDEIGYRLGP